jgi:hypothetical protein
MKKQREPICEHCGEYDKCICVFTKCAICGNKYSNWDADPEHDIYEYRGFYACKKDFDILIGKVDTKRQEVIEVTEASINSQRNGEFANNSKAKVASDGLPFIKAKEPQILTDYEKGIL